MLEWLKASLPRRAALTYGGVAKGELGKEDRHGRFQRGTFLPAALRGLDDSLPPFHGVGRKEGEALKRRLFARRDCVAGKGIEEDARSGRGFAERWERKGGSQSASGARRRTRSSSRARAGRTQGTWPPLLKRDRPRPGGARRGSF